jgi:hypothetical protein
VSDKSASHLFFRFCLPHFSLAYLTYSYEPIFPNYKRRGLLLLGELALLVVALGRQQRPPLAPRQ